MSNTFNNILPNMRPEIKIKQKKILDFNVMLNEVPWMYCDVNLGTKVTWGIFEAPTWELTEAHITSTKRRAKIHSIDCFETEIKEYDPNNQNECKNTYSLFSRADNQSIQFIAESKIENDTLLFMTIYDDEFLRNWGVEFLRSIENLGFDVYLNGDDSHIKCDTCDGSILIGAGIYEVQVGNKTHDCLRVIDRYKNTFECLIEAFIDRNGNTILCRRYNSPEWNKSNYGDWSERLPNSKKLYVNGKEYIHWYDCLSNKTLV